MERITANLTGKARRERLNGRSYLVVPMTLIVPGVLDGSDGPIYYPPEEISLNHSMWDGMPLVAYHPLQDGRPISARNPLILDKQSLGFVFNSRLSEMNSLLAEGWFDELLVNAFDLGLDLKHRIMPKLQASQPIELSTGVFVTRKEPTPGVSPSNRPYERVARGLRADHVAILPDQVGACSVKEGCGVFVTNHRSEPSPIPNPIRRSTMPLTPEQRKSHVDFLMANCSCWRTSGSEQILNSIPDDKLVEMKADADKHVTPPTPATPPNQLPLTPQQIDQLAEVLKAKLTPPTPAPAPSPAPVPTTAPAVAPTTQPVANTVPVAQPLTSEQWLTAAPPAIKALFTEGLNAQQTERQRLADALVANLSDPVAKQQRHSALMQRSLDDLRLMHSLLPAQTPAGIDGLNLPGITAPIIHLGGGPAPTGTGQNLYPKDGSDQGLLMSPTINWGREPSEAAKIRESERAAEPVGSSITQPN